MANNYLTNGGKDMSGVIKLCEALPQSKISSLKCVTARPISSPIPTVSSP